jgi:hypothetical protein
VFYGTNGTEQGVLFYFCVCSVKVSTEQTHDVGEVRSSLGTAPCSQHASRGVLTRRTSSGATGYVLLSAFDENNGYEMYFPRSVVDGAS